MMGEIIVPAHFKRSPFTVAYTTKGLDRLHTTNDILTVNYSLYTTSLPSGGRHDFIRAANDRTRTVPFG